MTLGRKDSSLKNKGRVPGRRIAEPLKRDDAKNSIKKKAKKTTNLGRAADQCQRGLGGEKGYATLS